MVTSFVWLLSFSVFSAQVDLSLRQTLDKGAPALNEQVKYTIYLKNSGVAAATNIVVENIAPKDGLTGITATVASGAWSYDPVTGIGSWTIPSLPAGDSLKLEITGTTSQRGVFFNIAQVKSSPDTDADSSPGNNSLAEDDITTACFSVPLLWYTGDQYTVSIPSVYDSSLDVNWYYNGTLITPSSTVATKNPDKSLTIKAPGNYTFTTSQTTCGPTGCCPVIVEQGQIFDLALQKTSLVTSVLTDSTITFNIDIYNQGQVKATAIQIADYIPAGLVLNDPGWQELTPGIATLKVPVDSLLPGHTLQKKIKFMVGPTATGTLSNAAEISSAKDGQGNVANDVDSTPDSNPSNDGVAKNDVINENHKLNPADDEDDSDLSSFTVVTSPVFDLAMRKILVTEGPLFPGSQVTFEFYIINQGTMNATDIKLTDYIPAGLILQDTSWTLTGNIATLKNPDLHLAAGKITCPEITFRIDSAFAGTHIINKGEISQAKGPLGEDVIDIDSSPDIDPLNDIVTIDDEVLQNGKTGGDEDDADFTSIFINHYTTLGDFVWEDKNANGIQDPLEPGIPGVTVRLETAGGDTLQTTVTNPGGIYHFDSLLTGNYVVAFQKPAGHLSSPKSVGDHLKDSDIDPVTGKSGIISLVSGTGNLNIDAGFYLLPCDQITSLTVLNDEFCMGDSTYIKAISALGGSIKYYIVPSGGTPVFTGASGENKLIFPTTSTVYYAESDSVNFGCTNTRLPIAVTVNARPSNPSSINIIEVCTGQTTNLNTHIINGITTPGGAFEWHTGPKPTSSLVGNVTSAGPGVYYLFEKSGAGCYSNPTLITVQSKTCNEIIDLSLLKTANKRNVTLSDTITYSVQLQNSGPDSASNIVIEDILPAGLLFVSSTDFTHASGILTLNVPKLLNGQSKTFTYKAKPAVTGTLINIAQVKSADQHDSDSTPGNGSAINEDDDDDEIIQVTGPQSNIADLKLQKVVSNSTPKVNDNITYFIRVTNDGPDTASNVTVQDILPAGLQLVSATGSDLITTSANTVTAKFNSILSGQEVEFSIIAKVTAVGTIANRAEVMTSGQQDPDSTPGSGTNEDDDDVSTITASQLCNPTTPIIAALNTYLCPGESTTLSAINCNGTITWSSGQTGNTITVSPSSTTTYTAKCTVGTCESQNSNSITISVGAIAPPLITASATSVCSGEIVTLTATGCTGTVKWSNNVLGASIQVSLSQTTGFTAVCIVNTCQSNASNSVSITISSTIAPPVISANKTGICVGDTVTLTAASCNATVTWSNGQTGNSIKVTPSATTTYTAICGTGTCTSGNSNPVTITTGSGTGTPTITASVDATCGGQSVVLTAGNCASGILWGGGQTTASITITPDTTATYTLSCGTGVCKTTASKTITVGGLGQTPVITVTNNIICKGANTTLTASSCAGTISWNTGATTNAITVSPDSTKTYTATCSTGTKCKGFASATVTVSSVPQAPIVTAGKDTVCAGESVTLTANNCAGNVIWSTGANGTTTTVSPVATTTYTATCTVAGCTGPSSVPVTIRTKGQVPVIVASKEMLCDTASSVTLTVSNCTGSLFWSTGVSTASITVKPTATTTYIASCTQNGCIATASKTIIKGIASPTPVVIATSLVNTCPALTVNLASAVTSTVSAGGKFIYRTGNTPASPAVTNPSAVTMSGTYYVFDSTSSGCISAGAPVTVSVTTCGTTPDCTILPATASAGKDSTICLSGVNFFTLNGSVGGAAGSGRWSTSNGTGSFDNPANLNAKYTYGQQDIVRGNVLFILTTNDPDGTGACVAARDTVKLTINAPSPRPTVVLNKPATLCFGDSVTLTVSDSTNFNYLWNTGDTTKSIRVKTAGKYWVKFKNNAGCSSLNSDSVTVTFRPLIGAPLVTPVASNVCPVTTVNLTTKVTSLPLTTNGVFEFHTGVSPSSPLVPNAAAVGAGTYIVFEKTSAGCYSQPALINVSITNCNGTVIPPSGDSTDVQVVITGDTLKADIGDTIIYTITVKNNGPDTASFVKVVNTLPAQLQVLTAPNLTRVLNTLNDTIPSLNVGQIKVYTYTGKVMSAGLISNQVQITPMSDFDLVPANNFSKFDVQCVNCGDPCIAIAVKADTTKQLNGSYNIRFTTLVQNCGDVKLTGVDLIQALDTVFAAPSTFTMVQAPQANTGSKLIPDGSFNGKTNKHLINAIVSELDTAKTDTITFVINLVPNGEPGPFITNTLGSGKTPADTVTDLSNDGLVINKPSSQPTVIKLFNSLSIGLALSITDTVKNADGSYDVSYQAIIKNNGSMNLDSVVVTDSLAKAFRSPASFTLVGTPVINQGSLLVKNSGFNGASDTHLLSPASKLAIGKADTIRYTVKVQPDSIKRFETQAVAKGFGNASSSGVQDLSNDGIDPDVPGSDPTVFVINEEVLNPGACIGLALYVADSSRQANGSYNVTYHAIVKNCGILPLKNISVCDTLSTTFTGAATATVVGSPTVGTGSTLSPDASFNGITNYCLLNTGSSLLAPGKVDTLKWTVNVVLNSNLGPFRNNVTVNGMNDEGQVISDVSNDGTNPDPAGSAPTVINFNDLPDELLGVAKKLVSITPVEGNDKVFDLAFHFTVKNYGVVGFDRVQVQDNLSATFGDNVIIDSVRVTEVSPGFVANTLFTGKGDLINLLVDSLSSLPVRSSGYIKLFARVDLTFTDTTRFDNWGFGIGYYAGNSTDDLSTDGDNPDEDLDGTPSNDSDPTVIDFGNVVTPSFTPIGVAKAVAADSMRNTDGSYNLTYTVIVRNYGTTPLDSVQLTDSLAVTFGNETTYSLIDSVIVNAGSHLVLNPYFGHKDSSDYRILIADSSSLAVGASDTITFRIRVRNNAPQSQTYINTIIGTATDSTGIVTDLSDAGFDPDENNNNNPGDDNDPTEIILESSGADTSAVTIFVSQGITPNNDGLNEKLIIKDLTNPNGLTESDSISVIIYNRWGQMIFKSDNYKKDFPGGDEDGWSGAVNEGLRIGKKDAVPDGTYYYVMESPAARVFGGKRRVNFITVAR